MPKDCAGVAQETARTSRLNAERICARVQLATGWLKSAPRRSHYGLPLCGGEGEIRTPEALASLPVFKTGAFNRSATSPSRVDSETWAVFCSRWISLFEANVSILFPL